MSNLEEFEPIIRAEAHKHNISGMDWEDVAQTIRIQLWRKEKNFNPLKSSYKTWANKVMRDYIKDLIRLSHTKKASFLNTAISWEELKEIEIKRDSDIDIGDE